MACIDSTDWPESQTTFGVLAYVNGEWGLCFESLAGTADQRDWKASLRDLVRIANRFGLRPIDRLCTSLRDIFARLPYSLGFQKPLDLPDDWMGTANEAAEWKLEKVRQAEQTQGGSQ